MSAHAWTTSSYIRARSLTCNNHLYKSCTHTMSLAFQHVYKSNPSHFKLLPQINFVFAATHAKILTNNDAWVPSCFLYEVNLYLFMNKSEYFKKWLQEATSAANKSGSQILEVTFGPYRTQEIFFLLWTLALIILMTIYTAATRLFVGPKRLLKSEDNFNGLLWWLNWQVSLTRIFSKPGSLQACKCNWGGESSKIF